MVRQSLGEIPLGFYGSGVIWTIVFERLVGTNESAERISPAHHGVCNDFVFMLVRDVSKSFRMFQERISVRVTTWL